MVVYTKFNLSTCVTSGLLYEKRSSIWFEIIVLDILEKDKKKNNWIIDLSNFQSQFYIIIYIQQMSFILKHRNIKHNPDDSS